eukprot:NODE_253_length_11722_cov_0.375118.p8 type:complete len:222 gc:universal NODE_253_length_11722_cov_0.375118:9057-9722(+)
MSLKSSNYLRIGFWNINGKLLKNLPIFKSNFKSHQFDIFYLLDTKCKQHLNGYDACFPTTTHSCGMSILYNSKTRQMIEYIQGYQYWTVIKMPQLAILSIYNAPSIENHSIYEIIRDFTMSHENISKYILGDFNMNLSRMNKWDKLLLNQFIQFGYCKCDYTPPNLTTFERMCNKKLQSSQIDHVFACHRHQSIQLQVQPRCHPISNISDHKLIEFSVPIY